MRVRAIPFPSGQDAGVAAKEELTRVRALVVAGGADPSDAPLDPRALQELRAFLERGGRVLLLGRALRLAHDLGIETHAPSVQNEFSWGYDARTAQGRARLGFAAVSGKADPLIEGMTAHSPSAHDYFVLGGAPLVAPLCAFGAAPPRDAELLGRLVVECDGTRRNEACEDEPCDAVVLARWRCGKGALLGFGLEPDLSVRDDVLRHNARTFTMRAAEWLLDASEVGELGYWTLPLRGVGAMRDGVAAREMREHAAMPIQLRAQDRLPKIDERDVPGASLLAHWGVVAAVHETELPTSRTPDQILQDELLPAFVAGASTLALELCDPAQGLPLPWSETDPLARPKDYLGSTFARGYADGGLARLASEAHARSMLVDALLDPTPFGREPRVQLASLRYVARQWADARRLLDGALDGVLLRRGFVDPNGISVRVMQDFQPAMQVTQIGGASMSLPGALDAIDAQHGRPLGLTAAGISDGWRNGYPAARFPTGVLDASARTLPAASLPSSIGDAPNGAAAVARTAGGSYPDWIAEQAVAFVRDRRSSGGEMLWTGLQAMDEGARKAAFGASMEPLTAAMAVRCSATGIDGYRAAQRALLPEVHADFAQTVPATAATVMLRNNHFRLLGTGGRLELDISGLARFSQKDAPSVVTLAESFFRTRFFGGRPDANELRTLQRDLLAGEPRDEGGYVREARIPDFGAWPRQIAFADAPRWPQRIAFALPLETGRFALRIKARCVRGKGVLVVLIDGEPLRFVPYADGALPIDADVALHLPTAAARTLQLEAQDGGALALDAIQLVRAGDVAASSEPVVRAGSIASMRERSSSTYHQESVEIASIADFPGFVVRAECERSARGLQQERRFSLLHHKTLRFAAGDGMQKELREPFVLASDDERIPDLAVVPLGLSRYERFSLDGGELVLRQQPEANAKTVFGFVFVDRHRARDELPHLARALAAIDRPATLDLGDLGAAELRSDLPFAWTRVVAVQQASKTPFLVREGGWWTLRGVQQDGARDYLRVLHLPGDAVSVVGGQALLSRTRPGPGSAGIVALRDPTSDAVTVRVLQRSSRTAPKVTMSAAFDRVEIDGKQWSQWNGRTITLPDAIAEHRIVTRMAGAGDAPRVAATAARLSVCVYDEGARELVLVADAQDSRPSSMPYVAWLAGPVPTSIEGGEIVDEKELRHADAHALTAARGSGTLIRFLPGIVRIRYGNHGS